MSIKKTSLIFLVIVIVFLVGVVSYNFFIKERKDTRYDYYYCENGIYYTYPKGFDDATATYYDKKGNKLARCYFGGGDPNCEEIHKLAGECTP